MRSSCCLAVFLLAGCGENMVQQPRYDDYEEASLFRDGKVMQPPPAGTVARDDPFRAAAAERPSMSLALVERGRERFEIYCSMCHGHDGRGNGVVPSRGFPHPPNFLSPRLRAVPAAHIVDVITKGYGVMYAYADRVAPADRWAIAAYVRAIQMSQGAPVADLTAADRAELERSDAL